MKILITGVAGFIGHAVAKRFIEDGLKVVGVDSLSPYYDVELKCKRVADLVSLSLNGTAGRFLFAKCDICCPTFWDYINHHRPDVVIHLAAQAGVRHSIDHPEDYVHTNLVGFANVLEACRRVQTQNLIYASSSSVYGDHPGSREDAPTHTPLSLYAATKQANERMAYSYSAIHGMRVTGLRFFTVYGPWGRPDMALWKFTESILKGEPITLYNHGNHSRDWTYIDDVVEVVRRIATWEPRRILPSPPAKIYNVGAGAPERLMTMVKAVQHILGKAARIEFADMQPGDTAVSCAIPVNLFYDYGRIEWTPLWSGIRQFIKWYQEYRHG